MFPQPRARLLRLERTEICGDRHHVFDAELRDHRFHQLAEGAGAAPLAAALQERQRVAGKRVAAILSGGNIDRPLFARVLAEEDAAAV